MVAQDLNSRDFLIRYYPDKKNRRDHRLIGLSTFKEIVSDPRTYKNYVNKVYNSPNNRVSIVNRTGYELVIYYR